MPSVITLQRVLRYANGIFNLACTVATSVSGLLIEVRTIIRDMTKWSLNRGGQVSLYTSHLGQEKVV